MNPTITAVPGLLAGHWTHPVEPTGCTALLFPAGARGGVAVPGHAPGGREFGTLDPTHLAGAVHGLVLTGGSAFGLATADGVMAVLAQQGIGFATSAGPVPLVPAAVLFDLPVSAARPDAAAGRAAAEAASDLPLAEGRVGAGAGARAGKWGGPGGWGGLGGGSTTLGPWTIGVVVAVNAFGSIRDPDSGEWLLGGPPAPWPAAAGAELRGNTTLAALATDAPLDRAGCRLLANMATAGLARAISPVFTPFDGDTVFAFSTTEGAAPAPLALAALGHAAAELLARAIARAVRAARG